MQYDCLSCALSRYVVIVHPMKARSWCTIGNTKILILVVWGFAIGLSVPAAFIMVSDVMK